MKTLAFLITLLLLATSASAAEISVALLTPKTTTANDTLTAYCMASSETPETVKYDYQLFKAATLKQEGTTPETTTGKLYLATKTNFDLEPNTDYTLACRVHGTNKWLNSQPSRTFEINETTEETTPVTTANEKLTRYCASRNGVLMEDRDGIRCVFNTTKTTPIDEFVENKVFNLGAVVWPSKPAGGWTVIILGVAAILYLVTREKEKRLARSIVKDQRKMRDYEW